MIGKLVVRLTLCCGLLVISAQSSANAITALESTTIEIPSKLSKESSLIFFPLEAYSPDLVLQINIASPYQQMLSSPTMIDFCSGGRACSLNSRNQQGVIQFMQFSLFDGNNQLFIPESDVMLSAGLMDNFSQGTIEISTSYNGDPLEISLQYLFQMVPVGPEVVISNLAVNVADTSGQGGTPGSGGDLSGGSSNPDIGAGGEGGSDQGSGNGNGEGGSQAIPEPSSYALMGLALFGVFAARRSRRRR